MLPTTRISYGWGDYPQYKEWVRPWLIWALGMHGWFRDRVQMRSWKTAMLFIKHDILVWHHQTPVSQTHLGNLHSCRKNAVFRHCWVITSHSFISISTFAHIFLPCTFLHPTSSLFNLVYLILPDLVLAYITSHFQVGFRNWLGWAVPSHRGRGFLSILPTCILPIHISYLSFSYLMLLVLSI